MLDEMSESNPEGYKSFVQNNIKQGLSEMTEQKQKQINEKKVVPSAGFLIKCIANLEAAKLDQDQRPIYQKLVIEQKFDDYEKFKKSLDKEVKIYVNVMHHERVKLPLNKNQEEIKNFQTERIDKWSYIPLTITRPEIRKSESLGNHVFFFNAVINSQLMAFFKATPQNHVLLIGFITEKLQELLKKDHNTLIKQYNPLASNEILFYKIQKLSIQRHTKKTYKNASNKIKEPQPILLEPWTDREFK